MKNPSKIGKIYHESVDFTEGYRKYNRKKWVNEVRNQKEKRNERLIKKSNVAMDKSTMIMEEWMDNLFFFFSLKAD